MNGWQWFGVVYGILMLLTFYFIWSRSFNQRLIWLDFIMVPLFAWVLVPVVIYYWAADFRMKVRSRDKSNV